MRVALDDPGRWTVSVLPLPRRQSLARAFGLCGGKVVGYGEARGTAVPHWWPGGQPEAITHPAQKRVSVGRAGGDGIPGYWSRSAGGFGGALGWRLADGVLQPLDLHPASGWESTIAMAAGGGAFAGQGARKVKKGEKATTVALVWAADGTMVELPPAEPGAEGRAGGTDGAWVVGRANRAGGQRAVLWPADGSRIVVVGDEKSITEATGVGDGEQVGVRWTGRGSAAALWRGSAESFVDLTPAGHESGWARDCARGFQVGHVLRKQSTRSGAGSMASHAALWRGDAASFVDLHAFVPAPWNASSAAAVEVRDGVLRIAGEVTEFGTTEELTPRESQYVIANRAAMWETPLD